MIEAMRVVFPKGQIGLLLLVIMGIVIALVMSVASRSLSDTVLSRQERESSAAFSVAETGVENAMNALRNSTNQQIGGTLSALPDLNSGVSFVTGNYKVQNLTTYSLFVREGETAHLDTTGFVGNLTISWTRKSDPTENIATVPCQEGSGLSPAAIEVSTIKASGVSRSYFNPSECDPGDNGFANSAIDGGEFYRSLVTFPVTNGTTVVRIKPIYAGATISVTGDGLKTQLHLINSRAVGGDAQKEIEVKRGLDAPASIFDYTIFSAGTIIK